jgi:T-complex protein 1 subunit gamma
MIELSRTQDEEVGDGTTSVIVLGIYMFSLLFFLTILSWFDNYWSTDIVFNLHWISLLLAGEMLHVAQAFIDKNYHPTVICRGKILVF